MRPARSDSSKLLPAEVSQPVAEAAAPYVVVGPGQLRVECATADAVANLFAALS